jgi:pimeloyl-ACP methyl ester carboxylesterase
MGGRLVSLFALKHPEYKTLVLWAPCNIVYAPEDDFLEQNIGTLKKEADEKGFIDFYDIFHDQTIVFPAEFAYDLLDQRIKGFKDFPGNILIVHGDNDITVDVKESISLYNDLDKCSEKKLEILEKADHGFGLWDGRISDNEKLIEHSFSFLKEYL